jgi:hypothetical protein
MFCKKMRNKKTWQQLEAYISEHSEAQFSHDIWKALTLQFTVRYLHSGLIAALLDLHHADPIHIFQLREGLAGVNSRGSSPMTRNLPSSSRRP